VCSLLWCSFCFAASRRIKYNRLLKHFDEPILHIALCTQFPFAFPARCPCSRKPATRRSSARRPGLRSTCGSWTGQAGLTCSTSCGASRSSSAAWSQPTSGPTSCSKALRRARSRLTSWCSRASSSGRPRSSTGSRSGLARSEGRMSCQRYPHVVGNEFAKTYDRR
jgi:hypothetical protein